MDDDGQMLLLGAVLLILGFFAIAGLLARTTEVVEGQDSGEADILTEASALIRSWGDTVCNGGNHDEDRFLQMQAVQRARGFRLTTDDPAAPNWFRLTGPGGAVQFVYTCPP